MAGGEEVRSRQEEGVRGGGTKGLPSTFHAPDHQPGAHQGWEGRGWELTGTPSAPEREPTAVGGAATAAAAAAAAAATVSHSAFGSSAPGSLGLFAACELCCGLGSCRENV